MAALAQRLLCRHRSLSSRQLRIEIKYLLDTSALLTLLEDETGAERVEHVLKRAPTLISAISLLEVRYITPARQFFRSTPLSDKPLRLSILV